MAQLNQHQNALRAGHVTFPRVSVKGQLEHDTLIIVH